MMVRSFLNMIVLQVVEGSVTEYQVCRTMLAS